tara:strand:+ start:1697 stop:1894 length:198 start_codon:yes stop_codon:yes gene_type:complete
MGGLCSTQEELDFLQKEFIRLDVDKSGTLCGDELEQISTCKHFKNTDWKTIIEICDLNGDGVIDF